MLSQAFVRVAKGLLLVSIGVFLILLMGGYYWSIPWEATTFAEAEEFGYRSFQKGLFQFGINGSFYTLTETFSAGEITRVFWAEGLIFGGLWLGFCIWMASITYLPKWWFLAVSGLLTYFLISLNLGEISLFGFQTPWLASVVVAASFVVPAYIFHAFSYVDRFLYRVGFFLLVSLVILVFGGVSPVALSDQILTSGYLGLVLLLLFYLLVIAEELVFTILYLVTQTRGSRSNHLHFISFSLIYLIFIGLYYARKVGFISWEFNFFNPLVLLAISGGISVWSLKFKRVLYQNLLEDQHFELLIVGLGLVSFGFLSMALFRGNDAVIDATNNFVIYAHLAFGVFFFFYVITNFIDPLMQGFQLYKVVYKEQNFPYATAKIGGFVAVAAFFLYAEKGPYLFYRAGQYNYLGDQAALAGESGLAARLYQEGSIFGHDNHFSNYKLAEYDLKNGRLKEANRRLGRAILRHPSPQAYVNLAGTYSQLGEVSACQAVLEAGLNQFPGNSELTNNLGMLYFDLGDQERAFSMIAQSGADPEWSQASQVNRWKLMTEAPEDQVYLSEFEKGNLAVKANIIAHAMRFGKQLDFPVDTASSHGFPLHRQAYLINRVWYVADDRSLELLRKELDQPMEYAISEKAQEAYRQVSAYTGKVNQVFQSLDLDLYNADAKQRGFIDNEKGKLALEHHALPLAEWYFLKAIENQEPTAPMNLVATQLEAGKFDDALANMSRFAATDSSFSVMQADFQRILGGKQLSAGDLSIRLYYLYSQFSKAELSSLLGSQSRDFLANLWTKISQELIRAGQWQELESYEGIFADYLDPYFFEESHTLSTLLKTGRVIPEGRFRDLATLSDSLQIEALVRLAGENALNEPLVLGVSQKLSKSYPQRAYDLLVQAIEINQTSVDLHKTYCLQAASMGFSDYGRSALAKLKELTTPTDYQAFEKVFSALLAESDTFTTAW